MVDPGLARALILKNHPKQRISNEASEAIAELIRLFVLEGRNRALVEVRQTWVLEKYVKTNVSRNSNISIHV
jgi:CENP-S associating Centromere protein X